MLLDSSSSPAIHPPARRAVAAPFLAALLSALSSTGATVPPTLIDLDGAVALPVYAGLQPDLIHGVSAKPAWERPLVRHVCVVAPDVLALTIDAKGIVPRPLEPYAPQPTDVIRLHRAGHRVPPELWRMSFLDQVAPPEARERGEMNLWVFVERAGKPLGWRVGPERNWLWPIQEMRGEPLDRGWADRPESYRLTSPDAPGSAPPQTPLAVFRKSKPHHKGSTGPGYEGARGEHHQIYLRMPAPLVAGRRYLLEMTGPGAPDPSILRFVFDDRRLRTEALHANLAGFHPAQVKRAWLSTWLGSGGAVSYDAFPSFEVIDDVTGETAFTGAVRRRKAAGDAEFVSLTNGTEDHLRTAVHELDFSALRRPGRYRLAVPGLGTSFPFDIRSDLWADAARLQLIGFLNQRSGIALGPPATDYRRPRNFHPADAHVVVRELDREAFFAHRPAAGQRDDNPFHRIEASLRAELPGNPNAWGSWADAADHDRRHGHLQVVNTMLELYESNPGFFRGLTWPLPEGANQLPDIVDEALWGIGLYFRTQRESGEIIYGVESLRHPNRGEPSWLDTLPLAVVPGVPASAVNYAAAAAHLAFVLRDFDPPTAESYAASAVRAFRWGMAEQEHPRYARHHRASPASIALASVHLYRLTEERAYHDAFVAALGPLYGWRPGAPAQSLTGSLLKGRWLEQREICQYALLPSQLADVGLQEACRAAILAAADRVLAGAAEAGLPLLRQQGKPHLTWVVEAEGSRLVVTAHRLTGERRYLDALSESCQYGMGANPLNLSYTSGLGSRFAYPMIMDAEYAQLAWPGGIATYGPSLFHPKSLPKSAWGWDQAKRETFRGQVHPSDVFDWPGHELYFRYVGFTAINEFTIHQSMDDQLLRWGYLAQAFSAKPGH